MYAVLLHCFPSLYELISFVCMRIILYVLLNGYVIALYFMFPDVFWQETWIELSQDEACSLQRPL